jgi:stage II sporulation protein D
LQYIKRHPLSILLLAVLVLGTGFYYHHIKFAEAKVSVVPSNIRIGLQREVPEIQFSVQGKYMILNSYNGEQITMAEPGKTYTIQRKDGASGNSLIRLLCDGEQIGSFSGQLVVEQVNQEVNVLSGTGALAKKTGGQGFAVIDGSGTVTALPKNIGNYNILSADGIGSLKVSDDLQLVSINTQGAVKRYRGNFDFRLDGKGITVINYLPIEEYLYSVVPSEMYSYWPIEALKAQAVVARTYALYSAGQYLAQGFDILATTQNQVYNGYDQETAATNKAVDETRGQVLTYKGQLILAAFHSSSGGYTGNCGDIWKENIPYLKAKTDPYDVNDHHYNWSVSYSAKQLAALFTAKNYPYSEVIDLEVAVWDETETRVKELRVKGLDLDGEYKEERIYNADQVRSVLGLKNSLFTLDNSYDEVDKLTLVTIMGSGYGHGIGMSQYGASGMAQQGYNYQDILQYYYTGVDLELNYGM